MTLRGLTDGLFACPTEQDSKETISIQPCSMVGKVPTLVVEIGINMAPRDRDKNEIRPGATPPCQRLGNLWLLRIASPRPRG